MIKIRVLIFLMLFPKITFAATPNAQTMLQNFVAAIPNLVQMITAIAYVLGMIFVVKGILEFKTFGESRTMQSRDRQLSVPIIYITVGAVLLFLPTSIQVGMSTFWTTPCPYCYIQQGGEWATFIANCFLIVQLVGLIAFIRGLLIFTTISSSGGGNTFSKGLMHVIGGILCMNIYQLLQTVFTTLGLPAH